MNCQGPGATHHYACDCREESVRKALEAADLMAISLANEFGFNPGENDTILGKRWDNYRAARAKTKERADGPEEKSQ